MSDNPSQKPLVTARNIFLDMFVLVLRLGFIRLKLITAELEDLSSWLLFHRLRIRYLGTVSSIGNLTREALMTRHQLQTKIYIVRKLSRVDF